MGTMAVSEIVASSAVAAATKAGANALIALSTTGSTAWAVSKYRPRCPILVVTKNPQTSRQSWLYRGCYGVLYDGSMSAEEYNKDREARVQLGISEGKARGFIKDGDKVVVVLGTEPGHGNANSFKVLAI